MRQIRDLPLELAWELARHEAWLMGNPEGRRANLCSANLRSADLGYADLRSADLRYADLHSAGLSHADLRYANLRSADLHSANLRSADLSYANLHSANLRHADLRYSALDPSNTPNAEVDSFTIRGDGWLEGFRTRATSAVGRTLQNDRYYAAEVFSTSDAECHPGWYLWPTRQHVVDFSGDAPLVLVRARRQDIHRAGSKWRSRMIHVLGNA